MCKLNCVTKQLSRHDLSTNVSKHVIFLAANSQKHTPEVTYIPNMGVVPCYVILHQTRNIKNATSLTNFAHRVVAGALYTWKEEVAVFMIFPAD